MTLREIRHWVQNRVVGPGTDLRRWSVGDTAHDTALALADLLQSDRFRGHVALTCRDHGQDGARWVHATISTMLLARATGCRYLHTPLSNITDNSHGAALESQRWEQFFGLGFGEANVPTDAELVRAELFQAAPARYERRPIVLHGPPVASFADRTPDLYEVLIPHLRRKYFGSEKCALPLHRGNATAAVALHVEPRSPSQDHAENDARVLSALRRVREIAGGLGRPLEAHLYSQGTADAFSAFAETGCILHLEGDTLETFHNLVMADVLVTATSSFDFVAALLTDGVVLYKPNGIRPLSRWIPFASAGARGGGRLLFAARDRMVRRRSSRSLPSAEPVCRWRGGEAELRGDAVRLAELVRMGHVGPEFAITSMRFDGVGGQAMGVASALAFSVETGCRYVHLPFGRMAHAVGSKQEWGNRWDEFLNLGYGEARIPSDAELVALPDLLAEPDRYAGRTIVAHAPSFATDRQEIGPSIGSPYVTLWPALRARYWQSAKGHIPLHRGAPGSLIVAVHVRRGDVTAQDRKRYVPEDVTLAIIARLREVAEPWQPLHINVYSEGAPEMFAAFAAAGCHLHLGTDTFETFHNLVTADILVAAPSAFSGFAAMLSTGIVISRTRCRDRRWIHLRRDGLLNRAALRRALLVDLGAHQRVVYWLRSGWNRLRKNSRRSRMIQQTRAAASKADSRSG